MESKNEVTIEIKVVGGDVILKFIVFFNHCCTVIFLFFGKKLKF